MTIKKKNIITINQILIIINIIMVMIIIVLILAVSLTFACDFTITKTWDAGDEMVIWGIYHNESGCDTKNGAIVRCTAYSSTGKVIGARTDFIYGKDGIILPGWTEELKFQIPLHGFITNRVKCKCLEY